MKVYADTSVLVAWFHPPDFFAGPVRSWFQARDIDLIWNPILRLELRHILRHLSGKYARTAWNAYRASEASKHLVMDVVRFTDLLQFADELSANLSETIAAGTWDCVHIAAAVQARSEFFVTCDAAQAEAAREAGVRKIHLFE